MTFFIKIRFLVEDLKIKYYKHYINKIKYGIEDIQLYKVLKYIMEL